MTSPESEPVEETIDPTEIVSEEEVQAFEISELDKVKEELNDAKNKYLRQLAETENMRKRLQKEKLELTHFATANLISEFLSPIDHMESALGHTDNMSDEVKNWGIGFKMILTQFKDVLSNNGVVAMDTLGKPFDPHLHEAIDVVESEDKEPGTVIEECLKGFKIGEKVIRPARVKVAKAPQKDNKE